MIIIMNNLFYKPEKLCNLQLIFHILYILDWILDAQFLSLIQHLEQAVKTQKQYNREVMLIYLLVTNMPLKKCMTMQYQLGSLTLNTDIEFNMDLFLMFSSVHACTGMHAFFCQEMCIKPPNDFFCFSEEKTYKVCFPLLYFILSPSYFFFMFVM